MIMSNGTSRDWHPILLEPATLVIVETVPALIWAVIISFLLYCFFSFISGKKDVPANREQEGHLEEFPAEEPNEVFLEEPVMEEEKVVEDEYGPIVH